MSLLETDPTRVYRFRDTMLGHADQAHYRTGPSPLHSRVRTNVKWRVSRMPDLPPDLTALCAPPRPMQISLSYSQTDQQPVECHLSVSSLDDNFTSWVIDGNFDSLTGQSYGEHGITLFNRRQADPSLVYQLTPADFRKVLDAFMNHQADYTAHAGPLTLPDAFMLATQVQSTAPDVNAKTVEAAFQNLYLTDKDHAAFSIQIEDRHQIDVRLLRNFAPTAGRPAGHLEHRLELTSLPDGTIRHFSRNSQLWLGDSQFATVPRDQFGLRNPPPVLAWDDIPAFLQRQLYTDPHPTLADLTFLEQFAQRRLRPDDISV